MSVREYAVLYLGKGGKSVVATGGGNVIVAPGTAANAELKIEGGQSTIKPHGSLGSAAAIDPTDGNVHTGTLDADCTLTLDAPVGSGACTLELRLTQDGTGGWVVTWPGSVTLIGSLDTTPSTSAMVMLETLDGGTTWVAIVVGAGGGGSALTVSDEGTPLATAATTLDFVGSGVVASGTGATKTITISGASVSDITDIPTAETNTAKVPHPDGSGGIEWGTDATGGGGGGALVLLEQHTASSSATLDFTTAITSTYDEYVVELLAVMPASNSVDLGLQMSTDGGSNYDAGGSAYAGGQYRWHSAAGAAVSGGAGTVIIVAGGDHVGNGAAWGGVSGRLTLYGPAASTYKRVIGTVSYPDGTNAVLETMAIGAQYSSATAVNAFRFLFSSGNIASGTIRCYGVAK